MELIAGASAALALGWLAYRAAAYAREVRRAEQALERIELADFRPELELIKRHYPWASAHGFQLYEGYRRGGDVVAVWLHEQEPVELLVVVDGDRVFHELWTHFSTRSALVTSGSERPLPPAPSGIYQQRFPGESLNGLWAQHARAQAFLIRSRRVLPTAILGSFEARALALARLRRQRLRRLFAWPLWLPLLESFRDRQRRDVPRQLGVSGERTAS